MGLQDAVQHLTSGETAPTKSEIIAGTAHEILPASQAFVAEVYHHPVDAAAHAAKTLITSAAMGAAIGYILPARGPAALIVAGALTVPMAVKAYNRLDEAYEEGLNGKSLKNIDKSLAKDTVEGTYDLGLSLLGGVGGTELGVKVATSGTVFGAPGQLSQRLVMQGENLALTAFKGSKTISGVGESAGAAPTPSSLSADRFNEVPKDAAGNLPGGGKVADGNTHTTADGALEVPPEIPSLAIVEKTGLAARLEQHRIVNPKLDRFLDGSGDSQMYFGSLHGHSRYSDGMGLPVDLYNKAIGEGQQVTTITDHNHLAARGGVSPDDPRAADQAKAPVIAASPIEYSQTFADAAATTTPGQHVSLVGTEMGTIGKVGGGSHAPHDSAPDGNEQSLIGDTHEDHAHEHDDGDHHTHGMMNPESIGEINPGGKAFNLAEARAESNAAAHIGGVNHINLFEVPTFFEAVRQPKSGPVAAIMRLAGKEPAPAVVAPDVVKYNDGDYKAMVGHLDGLTATDGGKPVIQLNHPRYLADQNPNTPVAQRGRDYGQQSFANHQEWLDRFATPYVRQVELIKGGALNPNPVDKVPTGNLDPTSFAGYIDLGVHASPTFGRDFHFGDPVGNPGATGIYAKALDKPGILNALRERRTIATTSSKNLSGVMTANDQFVMGAILDHSVVPSLALKMKVDGNVDPAASYTLKLWGDTNVGDGKLAEVVQQKTISGKDLLTANQTVAFDAVSGTTGKSAAYYVEVQRTAPGSGDLDRMWTAPIWLENLAGSKHTLFSKFMAGQASQTLPNPFRSNTSVQ